MGGRGSGSVGAGIEVNRGELRSGAVPDAVDAGRVGDEDEEDEEAREEEVEDEEVEEEEVEEEEVEEEDEEEDAEEIEEDEQVVALLLQMFPFESAPPCF